MLSISMNKKLIMGILNTTPDSLYDGGKYYLEERAFEHAKKMLQEGADIIDIGGESSRPGSMPIDAEEELSRVLPVIQKIKSHYPDALLSIDTYKPEVAEKAVLNGVSIINDIYGMKIDGMAEVAASSKAYIIIMHMQGTPQNMQLAPHYQDVVAEVGFYFKERISFALKKGIAQSRIILDPGIGFGKSLTDNLLLMKNLGEFKKLGCPVLIGASRKSMLGKILGNQPQDRKNGTIILHTLALAQGADILRVHDVPETKEMIQIYEKWASC